jgi:hypothetical protein
MRSFAVHLEVFLLFDVDHKKLAQHRYRLPSKQYHETISDPRELIILDNPCSRSCFEFGTGMRSTLLLSSGVSHTLVPLN